MYKNYFFLNRSVIELAEKLRGFSIVEIYSQEKDTLIFRVKKDKEEKFLEICSGSANPFIVLKDVLHRAKKNTLDFFGKIIPAVINDILIAENERVVLILCDTASIYFFIRGNNSNIIAELKDNELLAFRNCDEETLTDTINEFHDFVFINDFYKPDLSDPAGNNFEVFLRENFLTISKDIIREARYRTGNENDEQFRLEIKKILKEIEVNTPAVMVNESTHEILLSVNSYKSFPYTSLKEFYSLNEAVINYLGRKHYFENLAQKKRLIEKHLNREISKLTAKLDNLNIRLKTPSREEEYNKYANLLLININKLYKGLKIAEIEDVYSDCELIKIKLDESISPKENIDNYYRKSKSEKINIEKSKLLFNTLEKEFKRLKNIEERFLQAAELRDYELIMKELKMDTNKNKETNKNEYNFNFKQYIIDKKYNVYVGKDSTNNDLLTTKFAKQNDFWFHARSVPGSHVVLRVENTKEAVPKSVLKAAASLAAYHSKAKTASTAPVTYTLKKYVYKKKGMDVGQVALTKEDVLLVKPEIPSNCEYVSGD